MNTFKQHLIEANLSTIDVFKRDNRILFMKKAIAGELSTNDDNLPAIKKTDPVIKHLEKTFYKTKEFDDIIKKTFGKTLGALKIAKGDNGFSTKSGSSGAPSGADWEQIICCAYNMVAHNISQDAAINKSEIKKWNNKFDDYVPKAIEIVNQTFGTNLSGAMKHFGSGSASLTKTWDQYFIENTGKSASAPTKTPKTDMFIGKQHISLKKQGGSQLMSGGKAETLATLAHAYANVSDNVKTKELDQAWQKLTKEIQSQYSKVKVPDGGNITSVKKGLKSGKEGGIFTTIKNVIINHEAMTSAIRNILTSPEIKEAVVREAMTGENKFSDPLPIATHMMIFNDGGFGKYHKIDDALVSHYAKKTKFNISFKSNNDKAWTALKGLFNEETKYELLDHLIESSIDECDFLLAEGATSRMIMAWISKLLIRIWNKIKALLLKGLKYIQPIFKVELITNDPKINY